jgi:RNA polymerase sigma factor FliA
MENAVYPIKLLWKKFKSEKSERRKESIKNELVLYYYSFVKKIAYKLAEKINWKVQPEELTSYGLDGLYGAIDKYDLTRGIKFELYAGTRIRGSMLDNLRKDDVVPRSVRINHNKHEQARLEIENELNRPANEIEILDKAGIKKEDYYSNKKKYIPVNYTSLQGSNMPPDHNNNTFKQDFNVNVIDHRISKPDSKLNRKEFFNKLLGKGFTDIERKIIYCYYWEGLSMHDISNIFRLSESRVSQMHKKALPKLKRKIQRNPDYFGLDILKFIQKSEN